MSKYYKNIEGDYIIAIGTGAGDKEITHEEYEQILDAIRGCPIPESGYEYKLRADLTWELVEAEITPMDDQEISGEEFMSLFEEVL